MRWIAAAALLLAGCASPPVASPPVAPAPPAPPPAAPQAAAKPPQLPHYRCDGGIEFDARFGDGSVELLFKDRDPQTLLRDAGGTSPGQTVYSSTKAKAEFGLEPNGRGAKLNLVDPLVDTRCSS
jgi:hypothetical protein